MRHKPLFFAALLLSAAACAPKLGDECSRAVDCSANGDRVCDEAQPGGYCTISNCEPGTCGDEGLCVRFRPNEPRLSSQWCMAKCGSSCDRDEYACVSTSELDKPDWGKLKADVLDPGRENGKFCVAKRTAAPSPGPAQE
jgi:hypothetical protein